MYPPRERLAMFSNFKKSFVRVEISFFSESFLSPVTSGYAR